MTTYVNAPTMNSPSEQLMTNGAAHVFTLGDAAGLDDQGDYVIPILPLTYGNDGTNITSISFTDGTNTWTQTLTYSGGILTGKSIWVKT